MFRRFILAALALAGLGAHPAFAGTDIIAQGLAASALQKNGDASNTTVIPTGTTTAKNTAGVVAPATLFVLSRLANAAQSDNPQINQPMSIPAWKTGSATLPSVYFSGEIVQVGAYYAEQMSEQGCTAVVSGSAPTITATSTFVSDGTCLWNTVAKNPTGGAPVILPATDWAVNTTFPEGSGTVTYSGTGSAANFTASISGTTLTTSAVPNGAIAVGQLVTGAGVPANTLVTAVLGGGNYTISNSATVSSELMSATAIGYFYTTASVCTSAASGAGPTGLSPAADNTCTWAYQYTMPTAKFNGSAIQSWLWNAGAGNLSTAVSFDGGTPFNVTGTGYMFQRGPIVASTAFVGSISGTTLTVSSVTSGAIAIGQTVIGNGVSTGTTITAGSGLSWTVSVNQTLGSTTLSGSLISRASPARYEFMTNSPKFTVRAYNLATRSGVLSSGVFTGVTSLRVIVCGPNRDHCQYVSPNHTGPNVIGYAHYVIDFSAVGGRQMRDIIIEQSGTDTFGGIDVGLQDDVSYPGGQHTLIAGWMGDSYPYGGGVATNAWGYPVFSADMLGITGLVTTAIGGCGYSAVCTSNTAISRINDILSINGGKGPDILFMHNGHNDINTNTPAQIATMQAAYLAAIRANPATAKIPIIMLGIQPRNTGGTAYPGGLTTEAAEQAQVASLNDPLILFCPVIGDPAGSWETGTGSISAQNGTGNEDWQYDTLAGHPNAYGNRQFAARLVKCVRNWLAGLGY